MFITVQIPLVDYRGLQDIPSKLDIPEWPDPDPEEDKMLYFGKIFNSRSQYIGPWDGEKRYCDVSSVMNFCGLQNTNFRNSLQIPWKSKITFRRFQSDGKFLAKFELGFYDDFEGGLNLNEVNSDQIKDLLYQHINNYLLCPVKIKKGSRKYDKKNRYTDFIPLIHTGNHLANSYYWSTYKGESKRSFDEKLRKNYVVKCDPIVIAQVDTSIVDIKNWPLKQIDTSNLQNPDIKLFFDYIPHIHDKNNYYIKTWLLGVKQEESTVPLRDHEFKKYDNSVKNLRINLIRLHSEIVVLKKVLERIGKQKTGDLDTPAVKRRVINHLHKIFYNLCKDNRNSQSQQSLVQVAIRLEETINPDESIEDQTKGLELVIEELKLLENNETNQRVTNYSIQYITNMGDQITIGTINGNFINKSHLVNSLNSAGANGMTEEFKQELLQIAKKIEDSQNEVAANILNTINEEFAKPQPEQNKSKIKKFWDGLVKVMPDITTIGKTIAGVIALF